MAVLKLSGISTSPSNLSSLAHLVGVSSGNADLLYDAGQLTTVLNSAGLASLTVVDQTLSGGAVVTATSLSTGNITVDCGKCPLQFITNGGNFTVTASTADGSCMMLVYNSSSAGTITFSGFSVGANTGDALTTTSSNRFTISIWRINSISGYRVAAHQ